MAEVTDGISYADWLQGAESGDWTTEATAAYQMVVLYDHEGRAQRVRGSSVPGMLAKTRQDANGNTIAAFYGENPA